MYYSKAHELFLTHTKHVSLFSQTQQKRDRIAIAGRRHTTGNSDSRRRLTNKTQNTPHKKQSQELKDSSLGSFNPGSKYTPHCDKLCRCCHAEKETI